MGDEVTVVPSVPEGTGNAVPDKAAEKEDTVRVLRVIEYVGPRSWVERTLENSIQGTKTFDEVRGGGKATIRAATVGGYPEILEGIEDLEQRRVLEGEE